MHYAYVNFIPKSYKANYTPSLPDKYGIISIKFYNSPFYIKRPFWLYNNLKNKINAQFDNHVEQINNLQINIVNLR